MYVKVTSTTLNGIESVPFEINITLTGSFPSFDIIGLPEVSVRESRVRVRSAIRQCGFDFPNKRVIVGMTGSERKDGPATDLAVALGLLSLAGHLGDVDISEFVIFGELSLSGELRPVRGAICHAEMAAKQDKTVICAPGNAAEAYAVNGKVITARTLAELVDNLRKALVYRVTPQDGDPSRFGRMPCWSDVRGQAKAKRALEVAVAGGFPVLLVGPPGCGKTMLARRLPSIMPPMGLKESIESTKIASVAGLLPRGVASLNDRPFRAPHHTGSTVSLVGGGTMPRPGEVSLAHNGVLYLDELPEFPASSIEAIGGAIREGASTITRSRQAVVYPAEPLLVAAANPCPCGFSGSPLHACSDSEGWKRKYLDRTNKAAETLGIKLRVELQPQAPRELKNEPISEDSETVRERVTISQALQRGRYGIEVGKSPAKIPLLEALSVVIATLDGRTAVTSSDIEEAAELFGLENNSDALEGRR